MKNISQCHKEISEDIRLSSIRGHSVVGDWPMIISKLEAALEVFQDDKLEEAANFVREIIKNQKPISIEGYRLNRVRYLLYDSASLDTEDVVLLITEIANIMQFERFNLTKEKVISKLLGEVKISNLNKNPKYKAIKSRLVDNLSYTNGNKFSLPYGYKQILFDLV